MTCVVSIICKVSTHLLSFRAAFHWRSTALNSRTTFAKICDVACLHQGSVQSQTTTCPWTSGTKESCSFQGTPSISIARPVTSILSWNVTWQIFKLKLTIKFHGGKEAISSLSCMLWLEKDRVTMQKHLYMSQPQIHKSLSSRKSIATTLPPSRQK